MSDNVISLVDHGSGDIGDIPGILRRIADRIESGDMAGVTMGAGVFFDPGTQLKVFGWGADADSIQSIGLLHLGIWQLSAP